MSHLTPSEFVDLLEGQLAEHRARHADWCAVCRSQFDDLREALRRSADVPHREPSALFWDRFSNRVREEISEPVADSRSWSDWLWLRPRAAFAAIAALLMVAAAVGWRVSPLQRASDGATEPLAINASDSGGVEGDSAADRAWDDVRAAAQNVGWEDAQEAGIAARPGAAERAILELSERERQQLISLLEEELKKPGE